MLKWSGARTQPCFTPLLISKVCHIPADEDLAGHTLVKELDDLDKLLWTSNIFKDCPQNFPVDKRQVLLNALLSWKNHVHGASAWAPLCLWKNLLEDSDESVENDVCKDFSSDGDELHAPVVSPFCFVPVALVESNSQGITEVIWHLLLFPDALQDIKKGLKGH